MLTAVRFGVSTEAADDVGGVVATTDDTDANCNAVMDVEKDDFLRNDSRVASAADEVACS